MMEPRTDYLPELIEESEPESGSDSSRSSLSEEETGFIHYNDDSANSSSQETSRSTDSKDIDYDIGDISVEIRPAPHEAVPLLGGTVLSRVPHPPNHPRSSANARKHDLTYIPPFFEERGEVSGHFERGVVRGSHFERDKVSRGGFEHGKVNGSHFEQGEVNGSHFERGEISGHFERDRLSSDFLAKGPASVSSSRRSSHGVTFCHGSSSSQDSGIGSQANSHRTPSMCYSGTQEDNVDIAALDEFTCSLDSYGSRRGSTDSKSASLKSLDRAKLLPTYIDDQSLPLSVSSRLDSSLDTMLDDPLRNYGICTPTSSEGSGRTQSSSSRNAAHNNNNTTTKRLTRRQFHRGHYIPARYPSQLHKDKFAKVKQAFKPPPSLCPASRYGKEARSVVNKPKTKPHKQWPKAPYYPSKARHIGTECEILRLVETLDLGIQCTPEVTEVGAQCTVQAVDAGTQYPRTRFKTFSTQTEGKKFSSTGTQNTPEMRSRMVETSTRILYLPEINTANAKVQTSAKTSSCECQTNTEDTPRKTLHKQDSIELEKQKNREQQDSSQHSGSVEGSEYNYSSCSFSSVSEDEPSDKEPDTCEKST